MYLFLFHGEGERTRDDIGPNQLSRSVVKHGPSFKVPTLPPDLEGAQHIPIAPVSPLSDHTNRNYSRAWASFSGWCGNQGIPELPATPNNAVTYLTEMAERGRRLSTVRAARTAISYGHRTAGVCGPHSRCLREELPGEAGEVRSQPSGTGEAADQVRHRRDRGHRR